MSPALPHACRPGALTLAAIAAMLIGAPPAGASGLGWGDCSFGRGYASCSGGYRSGFINPYVIHVPQPTSEDDKADAKERDRLWRDRCRPVVKQDAHGISRYSYAAPGCEYGKYE